MKISVTTQSIHEAATRLQGVVRQTPLEYAKRLSTLFGANVYIKREDLQEVRSYKIRGAYNLMSTLSQEEKDRGVVTASAGNHAQGVAFSAAKLQIAATIFMPIVTPLQKINKVKQFGGKWVTIQLIGQTFDESSNEAKKYCLEKKAVYVPPFDDERVISGQGTVGKEIFDELQDIDYVLCPIGGGGLVSGVSTYVAENSPKTEVIGIEPLGAACMLEAFKKGKPTTLAKIDTFVDGAAVKTAGEKTYKITKKYVKHILTVPEGKVCTTMIELYQNEGIIAEPAGALAIAALEQVASKIKEKTVICILSGGNNDILRYPEIMERSLVYQGRKHYFLIEFTQKPGQLRKFVDAALGPTDDIVRFEYIKKTSRETGAALVGIELAKKEDYEPLIARLNEIGINFTTITSSDILYHYLV